MYAVRRARKRAKPGGTAGMIDQTCPSKNWDRSFYVENGGTAVPEDNPEKRITAKKERSLHDGTQ